MIMNIEDLKKGIELLKELKLLNIKDHPPPYGMYL
jgi:hypothetical protein